MEEFTCGQNNFKKPGAHQLAASMPGLKIWLLMAMSSDIARLCKLVDYNQAY